MHLLDHGRRRVEETYQRPLPDRLLRALLKWLLPKPGLFRLALIGAKVARPFAALFPGRLSAMIRMSGAPVSSPSPVDHPQVFSASGERQLRVAMLSGCAQQVVGGGINEATIRLLRRHGVEVAISPGAGCCGALTQHMGDEDAARASARANISAWLAEKDRGGLDAIVINASGCGTTVKDYGHLLQHDPEWAAAAAEVSSLAVDISELMVRVGLRAAELPAEAAGLGVAYHAACSLQHGQKIVSAPKELLREAGYTIRDVREAHLCCGSAGTYNLLQPEIAEKLGQRKAGNLKATGADIVAAGNVGCMVQIAAHSGMPVVHTVELLDWATGGPRPAGLDN